MDLEIDFLPVGEKSQSGDAIVLRYGNLNGRREEYRVVVLDSGFRETGDKVVEHIIGTYNTDTVDLIISSHPDNDHSGGIPTVMEKLKVNKIWMHKPWDHTDNISKLFKHGLVTDDSVENRIEKSLLTVKKIEDIAKEKDISIEEPFFGLKDDLGGLIVLGPNKNYYKNELLPNFRCTPEPKKETVFGKVKDKIADIESSIKDWIDERWDLETLDHSGETSAENNSSAIILLNLGDEHILFTADAGQPALENVICILDDLKYDYGKIKLVQVPHHGSHRNINPTILDKIVGPKLSYKPEIAVKEVVVSVAKESDDKHPSKKVSNAFARRGAPVHDTSGQLKYYGKGNAPRINSYGTSVPLPFFERVETHD